MNRDPTKIVIPLPETAIDEIVPKSFFLANLTLWQQRNCVRLSDRSLPFGRRRLANGLAVVPMGIMIQPLLKSQRKTAPMQPFFERQRKNQGMEISDTPLPLDTGTLDKVDNDNT
jgi:hypothetical protein